MSKKKKTVPPPLDRPSALTAKSEIAQNIVDLYRLAAKSAEIALGSGTRIMPESDSHLIYNVALMAGASPFATVAKTKETQDVVVRRFKESLLSLITITPLVESFGKRPEGEKGH